MAREVDDLLSQMQQHGPLKRAYVPLRTELPSMIAQSANPHTLVLSTVERLLGNRLSVQQTAWPGTSASAYVSLLIDAASGRTSPEPLDEVDARAAAAAAAAADPEASIEVQLPTPSTAEKTHAATLCSQYPQFFRKLCAVYRSDKDDDRAATAAAALDAARTLWARGDCNEVALLIADHGLHGSFDVREVLRAAVRTNKPHAAAALGRTGESFGIMLIEELLAAKESKQAVRLLPKLGLTLAALPVPMRQQLRLGALYPRLAWISRSKHWDRIDSLYQELAAEVSEAANIPTVTAPPSPSSSSSSF